MAQLSYITTTPKDLPNTSSGIPTDEHIGLMVFDTSGFEGAMDAYPLLYHNFKDGKPQNINNMDEAAMVGITNDGFMNGMVYYHLSQFFEYIENPQSVYVVIADCSEDWDVILRAQQAVSGRIFHACVWTHRKIWKVREDGSIGFTSLITDLQEEANEINGKIGESTHTTTPLSILLFGNTSSAEGGEVTHKNLPDATVLECPKVSVILAQNGSEEVHAMQSMNPQNAPVGCMGLVMAFLALCGAEESIANLQKCDLNKNEGFNYPEWGVGESGTRIDTVHRIMANTVSSLGYIVPVDYEELEASYFLSSDQTLSSGSFCSIANNRVMHKCRRVVCSVMLPYVNSTLPYSPTTKTISDSAQATIISKINDTLESVMVNEQGLSQIDGASISFQPEGDMLDTDSLNLRIGISPVNYSGYLTEDVAHSVG